MFQESGIFMIIEGNLKLKDRWKQLDPEKVKIFIVTLLLVGAYKSKEEPVQLRSKDDIRPIFKVIFTRMRFQETLYMMRFDNACEMRQNRSPSKL